MSRAEWLREDRLPHIYCSGCGNGTVINCTLAAVDEVGWRRDGRSSSPGSLFITAPGTSTPTRSIHARPGARVCHRGETGATRPESCRLHRGRRSCRYRREPLHPRLPPERGHDRGLHEQPDLRMTAVREPTTPPERSRRQPHTVRANRRSILRIRHRCRRKLCRPLDVPTTSRNSQRPSPRASRCRGLRSSRCGHSARRTTAAPTG